jgi:hypothetical protein
MINFQGRVKYSEKHEYILVLYEMKLILTKN